MNLRVFGSLLIGADRESTGYGVIIYPRIVPYSRTRHPKRIRTVPVPYSRTSKRDGRNTAKNGDMFSLESHLVEQEKGKRNDVHYHDEIEHQGNAIRTAK